LVYFARDSGEKAENSLKNISAENTRQDPLAKSGGIWYTDTVNITI